LVASVRNRNDRSKVIMLKANVGLSRKISRDYQSSGYAVNLEGEILVPPDDPEAVLVRVQELFQLAQEALNQEIDRDQGEQAIGRHDMERPQPKADGHDNGHVNGSDGNSAPPKTAGNGKGSGQSSDEAASNKQVQFLLNMGKRFKLSTSQLEGRIADILGRHCGVYELTKKEAGLVLDHLTKSTSGNGKGQQER